MPHAPAGLQAARHASTRVGDARHACRGSGRAEQRANSLVALTIGLGLQENEATHHVFFFALNPSHPSLPFRVHFPPSQMEESVRALRWRRASSLGVMCALLAVVGVIAAAGMGRPAALEQSAAVLAASEHRVAALRRGPARLQGLWDEDAVGQALDAEISAVKKAFKQEQLQAQTTFFGVRTSTALQAANGTANSTANATDQEGGIAFDGQWFANWYDWYDSNYGSSYTARKEEQAARILGTRYTANPADPQPAADPSASSSSQLGEDGLSKGEHDLLQGRTAGETKTVRTLDGESR